MNSIGKIYADTTRLMVSTNIVRAAGKSVNWCGHKMTLTPIQNVPLAKLFQDLECRLDL